MEILSAIFLTLSAITFFLYVIDKRKAQNGGRRIREKTLLLFSVLGGALGGLFAMSLVRHKTKKWYFWFVNWLGLFLHLTVLYLAL